MYKSVAVQLLEILGNTYGGPSIGKENGEFVIYVWGDGPVEIGVLARGKTLKELLENYSRVSKKEISCGDKNGK